MRTVDALVSYIEQDEPGPFPGFYGLGLYSCHFPQHISQDIMNTIATNVTRPPVPPGDYNDVPESGMA